MERCGQVLSEHGWVCGRVGNDEQWPLLTVLRWGQAPQARVQTPASAPPH